MERGHRAAFEHVCATVLVYKKPSPSHSYRFILRLRQDNTMNQDEDFVFACLLGAYIQSLRQQQHATSSSCRAGRQEWIKAKKADEKAKIMLGARMAIRRQNWAQPQAPARVQAPQCQSPGLQQPRQQPLLLLQGLHKFTPGCSCSSSSTRGDGGRDAERDKT